MIALRSRIATRIIAIYALAYLVKISRSEWAQIFLPLCIFGAALGFVQMGGLD